MSPSFSTGASRNWRSNPCTNHWLSAKHQRSLFLSRPATVLLFFPALKLFALITHAYAQHASPDSSSSAQTRNPR
jgi:hypothetical protein